MGPLESAVIWVFRSTGRSTEDGLEPVSVSGPVRSSWPRLWAGSPGRGMCLDAARAVAAVRAHRALADVGDGSPVRPARSTAASGPRRAASARARR
jgi:hypothetical protein